MPFAQTKMGICEAPQRAAKKFQRRTRASSALVAFASDYPFETAELIRRGQPHFLIECEDSRRQAAPRSGPASSTLPHFVRLTRREQEVARLVCEGRSNQEIANDAGLSLPTVKKHLHAIFRKLEVPSRSRLMALMR